MLTENSLLVGCHLIQDNQNIVNQHESGRETWKRETRSYSCLCAVTRCRSEWAHTLAAGVRLDTHTQLRPLPLLHRSQRVPGRLAPAATTRVSPVAGVAANYRQTPLELRPGGPGDVGHLGDGAGDGPHPQHRDLQPPPGPGEGGRPREHDRGGLPDQLRQLVVPEHRHADLAVIGQSV